jgi:shikimate dehydrogenase
MRISGTTELIAHIGFPTHGFKSPLIYNPYFAAAGIDAVVVPMGCRAEHFPAVLRTVFLLTNVRGALITMPHKQACAGLVDEVTTAVAIAGSCNAVRRLDDGRLHGDVFDGEGFVRALTRKGCAINGARVFITGAGGVGSAIAAALATAGASSIAVWDVAAERGASLAARLTSHYPALIVTTTISDPAHHDIVVNATPAGTAPGDPMPMDPARIDPAAWVADVVLFPEMTPFLLAAQRRGCRVQVGSDMLYEQIPVYLEYFGLPTTTAERLRELTQK